MLKPYRDLLATPGGLRFSSSAFVARMPIAMVGLGIVLLVVAETGRYGRAGALSATFALVNAGAAPAIARLVDRLGQRRVLLRAVPLHLVALVAFVVLASREAPSWAQVAAIVVAALAAPSIGSLVRARWGYVLGPDPRLGTAYALEAVLDELIFVVGPLLVTLLATLVATQLGLLTAGLLLAVGTGLLVSHQVSEPPPSPHAHDHPSALRSLGLPPLMAVMVFVGGVFGAVEISAVAFADETGHRGLAGPLLACYATGSMLAGLAFGSLRGRLVDSAGVPWAFSAATGSGAVGLVLCRAAYPAAAGGRMRDDSETSNPCDSEKSTFGRDRPGAPARCARLRVIGSPQSDRSDDREAQR